MSSGSRTDVRGLRTKVSLLACMPGDAKPGSGFIRNDGTTDSVECIYGDNVEEVYFFAVYDKTSAGKCVEFIT